MTGSRLVACFLLSTLQGNTALGALSGNKPFSHRHSAAAVKGAECIGDDAPVLNGKYASYKSCFFGDAKPRFFSAQKKWGFENFCVSQD